MSTVLRVGAVHSDYGRDGGSAEIDSYDDGSAQEDYPRTHYFHGCFGLPYQDHNYGAPPPLTPPPKVPSPSEFIDKLNGHIEIEEVSISSIGHQPSVDVTSDSVDDSVTRCICDFTHDDGYMICCDKCSVWQHIDCMAVDRANIPESYFCEICEPRPLDKERARQIQLRKREFILAADSSTDTDPEEPANRRMSQDMGKKGKMKKRTKTLKSREDKAKKTKKDRKDIKKEKENKDLTRKLRISLKDSSKKVMKNKAGKKSGLLSLIINENAQQDPWDSSHSPWVDKYEEAKENQYSADMQAILGLKKLNGSLTISGNYDYKRNGRLLVQLCHVTDVSKNRKGLEASETIGEGEPIIEYTGNVMLREQFSKDNFYKRLNPFVLFNSMFDNIELCIDATSYGNIARFIRRSCKSNAEVKHTFEDGELTFIVVATKVIPRGSEITIPYDYNYKECTYCVECACLRNNCPVAKYFKRKQNAQNKKGKIINKNSIKLLKSPTKGVTVPVKLLNQQPPKSPKSPAASLPRSPVKSPIRKSISVEEPVIKEEYEEIKQEPELPPSPPPPMVSPVKEERASEVKEEACNDPSTDSGTDQHDDHHDTPSESEENPSSERSRRLSREDRKMEAIMKAFEKLEKRQERRKEALARIEGIKKPISIPKPSEDIKREKTRVKVQQEQKESRRTSERISNAEEAKKEKEKLKIEEKEEEKIPEVAPIPVPLPAPVPVPVPQVKKEVKVSHRRKKKSSSRRKSRTHSTNAVKSEPQSHDESSNTVPSCPLTPVSAPPDVSSTPPSFKFLKTKKHLMNEWLSEKSQDVSSLPPPSTQPSKIEPLEVQVEENMYVACRPSPRNALDHMRRNSTSAGCSSYSTFPSSKPISESSSIGSAKKRWLRQAMFDKPLPGAQPRPMSPLGPVGGSSPNPHVNLPSPHVSLPSPGTSPPGDYITPLKKRRLASYRESLDHPPAAVTVASDVGSSAPEDQVDEAIGVTNPDPLPSEGPQADGEDDIVKEVAENQELVDPSSSIRSSIESTGSDTDLRPRVNSEISDIATSGDESEKVTSNLGSSFIVTSNVDSVTESSNECDSRLEVDSVEDTADICDNSCQKSESMEVDSTQSDSCQVTREKKEALCDSTCKVEDIQPCSSSQSVSANHLSLVDSSSDVNSSENSSEIVQTIADSIVDNMLQVDNSVLPENVGSSSDRNMFNGHFDVTSSSESNQSSNYVESSQITESVSVSSTEQTCSSYSATSNLEGGIADSSMSENKTDLSDLGVSDVSGTGDSTQYVNNDTSAIENVGEPVASSSMAEDSGVSSEPSTPHEANHPAKKKVSLLEYRKRLKEKTTTCTSTPSSSKSSASSTIIAPSSTTSPVHRHHRFSTLPSLPLFDSSPTKDHSSRYQFKSSSDLIRRKSAESEKRPQLSLAERLRMEFGLEDSEEEKESEKEAASTPVTSSSQHPPLFQHPTFPQSSVMIRGPSSVLAQNGPQGPNGAPGPVPTVTNISGGIPGPIGSSPILPSNVPTPHMLMNGTQPQGIHPSNSGSVGKAIPSLLSIKTFPTLNLPNGTDSSSSPPPALDQGNMFHSNSQGGPANQHLANHMNNSPVGFSPPPADQFSSAQTPPMFNQTPNGTNHHPASQQNFNGTNMPSNGPIVHDYNHGYNSSDQSIQKHYHSQDQRKKSKKFKRKHYSNYQDSGGGHYH